jgi:hypothetical protein
MNNGTGMTVEYSGADDLLAVVAIPDGHSFATTPAEQWLLMLRRERLLSGEVRRMTHVHPSDAAPA